MAAALCSHIPRELANNLSFKRDISLVDFISGNYLALLKSSGLKWALTPDIFSSGESSILDHQTARNTDPELHRSLMEERGLEAIIPTPDRKLKLVSSAEFRSRVIRLA